MSTNHFNTLLEIVGHAVTQHEDVRVTIQKIVNNQQSVAERMTLVGIDEVFPIFSPKSGGTSVMRAEATVEAINQSFRLMASLIQSLNSSLLTISEIESSFQTEEQKNRTSMLEFVLNKYGSDKASTHAYHHFYANAFEDPTTVDHVLEIGLGTNNIDVLSSMGPQGKPGASLRAFRDFFPKAEMHGCDVDARILFSEERINTFRVDQTKPDSFYLLPQEVYYDLMIDDGLHSPHANLASLTFFLSKIKKGGWAVIEDIGIEALPIWQVVAEILPRIFQTSLYKSKYTNSMLFAVQRIF